MPIRGVDYAQIGRTILNSPTGHPIDVCSDHFGASSQAGQQYTLAVAEINRIEGSTLNFVSQRTDIAHKNAYSLFSSSPAASYFDYVDVEGDMPNRCSLPGDLTFAMRTCKYDKSGGNTNHFTIMARSTAYDHFSTPSSTNYPKKHGILHELSHALGMSHTPSWAEDDRDYISTMQGNLDYLSALDVGYLRNYYGESPIEHRNYVASSLTRFDGLKGIFSVKNSAAYFIDGDGILKDCATSSTPLFYVAWFNTGTMDGESTICGANQIFLRQRSSRSSTIALKTWRPATMPYLSQDQWLGAVESLVDSSSVDFSQDWELVFEVNAWETLDEVSFDDNEVSMDVSLYNGSCP